MLNYLRSFKGEGKVNADCLVSACVTHELGWDTRVPIFFSTVARKVTVTSFVVFYRYCSSFKDPARTQKEVRLFVRNQLED